MPDRSSADPGAGARLVIILLGYIPLFHAALLAFIVLYEAVGPLSWRLGMAAAALYLAPPLIVNSVSRCVSRPAGSLGVGTGQFLVWWFCSQWQMVFNRFRFLEEALRLVPSLYSLWLRLWGARIGALVYWSPGAVVFDRQWIEVGDRAVIGAGARLAPHYLTRDELGRTLLIAAPVRIGNDAIVGAYSIVSAGVSVEPGSVTRPARPLRPFTRHEETPRLLRSVRE